MPKILFMSYPHPENLHISDNPLVVHAITQLRRKDTPKSVFTQNTEIACTILLAEALQGLALKDVRIETPIEATTAQELADKLVIISILRAGLAFLSSAERFFPDAGKGFAGLKRDETTAEAHEYYWNVPKIDSHTVAIVCDPMLATGGTALMCLERLAKLQPKEMRFVSLISAPEGITHLQKHMPEVKIFTGAVDQRLNERKYIVPGLGDAGDRLFGTV